MTVRIDFTQNSSVAVCSCGWRTITTTRPDAWKLAATHEQRVHPGTQQAAKAAYASTRSTLENRHPSKT